jgi:hypothetical protein
MANTNRAQHAGHQAAYRQRLAAGAQAISKPWEWLTRSQVQELALQAYRSATYALADPEDWPDDARACFIAELTQAFEVLASSAAQNAGIAGGLAGAQHYAQCMLEDTPADWNPQYPIYKQVTPASTRDASGVVINAATDNANDHDLTA